MTRGRTVWIDVTNSPHVLFFRPILRRLDEAGVPAVVTARDFAQTLGLLERYGIGHTVIGGHGGASVVGKARVLAGRTAHLYRFARSRGDIGQAVSHGCVRVQKARELAIKILEGDKKWTPAKIDAAMHSGQEVQYALKRKIPVYIAYFTAVADSEGNVKFFDDVYKRDNKLARMLYNE